MTTDFALHYIPMRMKELGYRNYIMRWRTLQIDALGLLTIDAHNEYYYLIESNSNIIIKSKFGEFNLNDSNSNEMYYEHRGKIEIINIATSSQFIKFIQIIPSHLKKQLP